MIDGVKTKELRFITDERGRLMEILRSDEALFRKFGQVYVTTNNPGVIKAWHMHKVQTDNVTCVKGMIKLACYDAREGSPTNGELNEFILGEFKPMLIQIPNGVYHGWMCISDDESIVVNAPTEVYDYENPDEYRLPFDSLEIPYTWELKHG